ncbi:MAG TPA: helicase-related protein, partial [Nitrolancea sp.]|nr:helicase-related protein [Nitrolancea sp.]
HLTGGTVVTGETPLEDRQGLYQDFKDGELKCLVLSRVANVGVDLPDASVMIQLSGAFGSRQEEAQRVGRLLRPKPGRARATFYTLVAAGTREVEFAAKRQRFLIDQGYRYRVVGADSF